MAEAGIDTRETTNTTPELVMPAAMVAGVAAVDQEVDLLQLNASQLTAHEASELTGLPVVAEGRFGVKVERTAQQLIGMAIFAKLGYSPGERVTMMGKVVQETYMAQAALRRQTAEARALKADSSE